MKKIFLPIVLCLLCAQARGQEIVSEFQNPSPSASVMVWWHWIDSNISKEGIKADLDWMHRSGIGGFHHFDAAGAMNGKSIVERLPYMQEGWKDAFRYAIRYADSLGMEIAIASAPGWSSTGGPWVKPENAMKKISWRTADAEGHKGKVQKIKLPEPFKTVGIFQNLPGNKKIEPWYEDIAVVAVRLPEVERSLAEMGASVSSSSGSFTVQMLSDGDLTNGSTLEQNAPGWIQYSFPEEVSFSALTLCGGPVRDRWARALPSYENSLECSDDGKTWVEVCRIPSGSIKQQTISFPAARARHFRLVTAAKNKDVTINEFVLHCVAKINHSEEKTGFAAPHDIYDYPTPDSPHATEAIDISSKVKNGVLKWKVPDGRWRIYRFGSTLIGKENHPAPPEATGLEVDKLDESAWRDYFDTYLNLYKDASGGLLGKKGIKYILTDSYEGGTMTWTPHLREAFEKRNGYDLTTWLPVLAGEIIDSSARSEAFLFDWRMTLGDLFSANYDRLNEISQSFGMAGRYTESHENGKVYIGDGMDLKRTAAVPMSAFWVQGTSIPMGMADIRESASTAHLYGRKIVAAESFTVPGFNDNAWSYYPGNLKYTADLAMSHGVTRFLIHESSHQPSDKHKPGLDLMGYGQWFNRHDTWAEYARYWTAYLSRSCNMLQKGRFVADVLWYYGEDANITGLYGHSLPEIPEGYAFDFINPSGLAGLLSVKDGKIVTPSGMQYSVLALGEHCKIMSLSVLKHIASLAAEGAVICGAKPEVQASLTDDRQEFLRLADSVWSLPNVLTSPLPEVLASVARPDFVSDIPLRYVHRSDGSRQIYWVRNFSDTDVQAAVSFRDARGGCTVLDPESGNELKGVFREGKLLVGANQALFLVFDENLPQMEEESFTRQETAEIPSSIGHEWTVTFDGLGAPEGSRTFSKLSSYTESDEDALKYFSGTATYRNTFCLDEAADGIVLDLGNVGQMADIYIDGRQIGFLWRAPYKIETQLPLGAGKHSIEIKVINTWANRLIGDEQSGVQRFTYTTVKFYRPDSPLTPSGLMGPVTIKVSKNAR